MDDPSSSIEDYLNKLVQEDDIERNRSKAESSIDFNTIGFSTESNLPNLSQVSISCSLICDMQITHMYYLTLYNLQARFNNAVTPGLIPTNICDNLPTFDNHSGWYYQDIQVMFCSLFKFVFVYHCVLHLCIFSGYHKRAIYFYGDVGIFQS